MIAPERKNTVLTRSEPVRCYMIIRFLSRIQINSRGLTRNHRFVLHLLYVVQQGVRKPLKIRHFTPWCFSLSGIHFRYCFDDLFPPVIIVFVPVLPETACLSPWFIVYLLPCACCQFVVHRIHCYRVLYFPVLPPARINHGIWRNRSTHVVLLLTHSYSVLCLATICSPSFLIIRGWTGNTEYFRVRIPDIEGFLDLLPGNKFIHHCNDGITRVNC